MHFRHRDSNAAGPLISIIAMIVCVFKFCVLCGYPIDISINLYLRYETFFNVASVLCVIFSFVKFLVEGIKMSSFFNRYQCGSLLKFLFVITRHVTWFIFYPLIGITLSKSKDYLNEIKEKGLEDIYSKWIVRHPYATPKDFLKAYNEHLDRVKQRETAKDQASKKTTESQDSQTSQKTKDAQASQASHRAKDAESSFRYEQERQSMQAYYEQKLREAHASGHSDAEVAKLKEKIEQLEYESDMYKKMYLDADPFAQKVSAARDFFGITEDQFKTLTSKELEKIYRKHMLIVHPDQNANARDTATQLSQLASKHYQVLKEIVERR